MKLVNMGQLEQSIVTEWELCNAKLKRREYSMINMICINSILAITPMAYKTFDFTTFNIFIKNILNQAFSLFMALLLPFIFLAISYKSMLKGNFMEMFINLLAVPLAPALMIPAIALDLLINLASFITRPIATLVYLAIPESALAKNDENNIAKKLRI